MSQNQMRLVVIGNGMGGVAAVEEVLKLRSDLKITIFGAERHVNYNRILLSEILSGKTEEEDIILNPLSWYEENDITLYLDDPVIVIDRNRKTVTSKNGIQVPYDKLLIAQGSLPFIPPIKGTDKTGVLCFRTLEETHEIVKLAKTADKAVVIGGGLLGLEAARGLVNHGLEVYVAHLVDRLMDQQLDEVSGLMLKKQIEKAGISVMLNHVADEIMGNGCVEGVHFDNGKAIQADLVLISTGIRPNVALAKSAGLAVNHGIVVNDYMETSHADIYAIGECIEHRKKTFGLVAPIMDQTRIVAETITSGQGKSYVNKVTSTTLKVAGIDLTSMGNFLPDGAGCEEITYMDSTTANYKKVVIQGNRVVGAILLGDITSGARLHQLIKKETDISLFRDTLLTGSSNGDADATMTVSTMDDDEIVCGCKGVDKGTIVGAIETHELTSRDGIGEKTKACTSCKSCGPMIDQLLQEVLGGSFVMSPKKTNICACKELDHESLSTLVKDQGLKSYSAVKEAGCLGDCGLCKPGVSYLLSEIWDGEFKDDRQARFINDRVHANIQNDGTFSVIPRIYGGVTDPDQLRRIADVADKYEVPMVKFTGGQRIDLLGVKKEDLPAVWADLDMPSGQAYAKAIRTVKTCVGSTFCRFGVGDSIALGIEMEKKFEALYSPHKVKLAVTGCPRNCAEAYVKDIGLVAIEGGWEIYIGGAAGMTIRKGDLLCRVSTPKEALRMATLFLQYYRENGEYLERTYGFVERIGLEVIQSIILDEKTGEQERLLARFELARAAVSDPWKEGKRPVHKRQFIDLGVAVPEGSE